MSTTCESRPSGTGADGTRELLHPIQATDIHNQRIERPMKIRLIDNSLVFLAALIAGFLWLVPPSPCRAADDAIDDAPKELLFVPRMARPTTPPSTRIGSGRSLNAPPFWI